GDGFWEFCTNPGEYFVEFSSIENTGFQSVLPHQGDDDEIDSDITHAFGLNTTNSFILKSGDVLTSIDGGFFMERNVSGIAWLDTNADGIKTENETRMEGILVQLYNQDQ
ncbi:hypothetical protein RZS08_03215, partial [Arthrospira platensis SPKY1]|nr:hypothetical protein [Arthrospira platensis SPKY1]